MQSFSAVAGKRYKLNFTVTMNGKIIYPTIQLVTTAFALASNSVQSSSSTSYAELTATYTGTVWVYISTTGDANYTFAVTSMITLGAVLDLEPEGITSSQWIDASGNNLHGTSSGALPTLPAHGLTNFRRYQTATTPALQGETWGSTVQLSHFSPRIFATDASVVTVVKLPALPYDGMWFRVSNLNTTTDLAIQDASATAVETIRNGYAYVVYRVGSGLWQVEEVSELWGPVSFTIGGAITGVSANVGFLRFNKQVTLSYSSNTATASAAATITAPAGTLPARIRLSVSTNMAGVVVSLGNDVVGRVSVGSDGAISWSKYDFSNFSGASGITGGLNYFDHGTYVIR